MKRNQLYTILGVACGVAYSWLFFADRKLAGDDGFQLCFFKRIFSVPCPSCGSTRAVLALSKGDWALSIWYNPLGIVSAILLVAVPLWLAYDVVLKKQTLLAAYLKTEEIVRIRWVAATLIILIIANWIWNFYKPL